MQILENEQLIYLDNNASTPCAPEAVEAMLPYLLTNYANSASSHLMGRRAILAVQHAREQIACAVGATANEIVLTSGATESNNMTIFGLASDMNRRTRIVSSVIEHKSVLGPLNRLEAKGFDITLLPVSASGSIDVDEAASVIDENTLLVTIQAANNEIGSLQPVQEIGRIARKCGAFMHSDASQLLGKIPFTVDEMGVDLASFSAHKVYGPKGVGCLFIRDNVKRYLKPILYGGGQESKLRPGTVNVPAAIGFGVACQLVTGSISDEADRVEKLRDFAEEILKELPDLSINGLEGRRLPGTISVTLHSIPADMLIARLPAVCIGTGSACTSGAVSPSHVITALGHMIDEARSTVRISIGRYNNEEEVRFAAKAIVNEASQIRNSLSGSALV